MSAHLRILLFATKFVLPLQGQKRLLDTIQKTAEQEYVAELQRQEHEAVLKAVKVDAADVAMIQAQFGLSKLSAERKVRECEGSAARAVRELMGL